MPRIVYSRHYNIGFMGLERLHPFDSRKYGRAWKCLQRHFGKSIRDISVSPDRPISRDELLAIHTADYLDRLRQSSYVATALGVKALKFLPNWMLDRRVLRPMRWAAMGTIVAARASIDRGFAVNLSGGYHHAKPSAGEGFCIYNDIALAVHALRGTGQLAAEDRVAYVDLDAHQGNGVCHAFLDDRQVLIYDTYNAMIYPRNDVEARGRIDCDIPLVSACPDDKYLRILKQHLPPFLDSVGRTRPIGLAIYNAGTDVHVDDPLGDLSLSTAAILERDSFVVGELRARRIPTLMLPSGGYTRASYQLIADSVIQLVTRETAGSWLS